MLIDINAYIGHWPFKELINNSCQAMVSNMDRFGIDLAVISNLNGIFYKNTQPANEALYRELELSRSLQDRLVPFGVINPIYAGWRVDFENCCTKLGMKGIRLYPLYHDYQLTNPALIELVKMARDRGIPVAFTLRMVDSRQRSWMDIQEEWDLKDVIPIVKEVPDAKYMILNVANSMELSDEEMGLVKAADLVMDTSGRSIGNLGELLSEFGKEKFSFGSHAPILDHVSGLLRIESLRDDEANVETKALLRHKNAERMIGF